ncbi:MAG: winged helix-turn-helix domain-containing protein, partial [Candidatus Tectomicrobia bacterium]|nr:winged helix-turn-helix domain-containing protein [Candidatus Tectomicrobia bacterium]
MNPTPHNWKDARRVQAWHFKQPGWSQRQIAEALGVSAGAVSQWMTRVRGQLWTRGRIAAVIQLAFGVSYHPRHVGRVCQAIRWRPQKPARRAHQRDEAAIAQWRDDAWA